jgi:hypothetical protein
MPETMSDLSNDELGDRICELAAHIAAATYRFLRLLAEFDRRQGWGHWGIKSCAHWLSWRCGIDLGAAREKVRVARALDMLPAICDSFSRGELSYSKVRAITRIATPETENDLLILARSGTANHVEKVVRGYRRSVAYDLAQANADYAERYLDISYDEDGSIVIKAKLPREDGALVAKAIRKLQDEIAERNRVPESTPGWSQPPIDRADALVELCRRELDGDERQRSTADRYQIFVHVDAETLRGRPGMSFLQDGSGLASDTVRRLLCDSSYIGVMRDKEGNVLDLGRKTRSISASLRRALNLRDHGCIFPGCTNDHFVDAHHVQHWTAGGETKLSNLVLLCPFHHRLVHEGGFAMQWSADGSPVFLRPDGREITLPRPRFDDSRAIERVNEALGLRIDAETPRAQWGGEGCNYNAAIEGLMRKNKAGRYAEVDEDVSAETLSPELAAVAALVKYGAGDAEWVGVDGILQT